MKSERLLLRDARSLTFAASSFKMAATLMMGAKISQFCKLFER